MNDDDLDAGIWLRFSMRDPELRPGDPMVPVTWYTPAASTSLYVDMPERAGEIKKRVILHIIFFLME